MKTHRYFGEGRAVKSAAKQDKALGMAFLDAERKSILAVRTSLAYTSLPSPKYLPSVTGTCQR